jgi:signal peptidase II
MTQLNDMMGKAAKRWYLLALLAVVLDQLTKAAATAYLGYGEPIYILPVFDLTLLHNHGAAFSFLSDAGGWQRWFFTSIAVVVSVVLSIWLYRLPRAHTWLAAALSLVLGGAIGNLIDRVRFGYVVDFISVHYQGWYFPAFNIADSAITVGAGLMLIDAFFFSGKEERQG